MHNDGQWREVKTAALRKLIEKASAVYLHTTVGKRDDTPWPAYVAVDKQWLLDALANWPRDVVFTAQRARGSVYVSTVAP